MERDIAHKFGLEHLAEMGQTEKVEEWQISPDAFNHSEDSGHNTGDNASSASDPLVSPPPTEIVPLPRKPKHPTRNVPVNSYMKGSKSGTNAASGKGKVMNKEKDTKLPGKPGKTLTPSRDLKQVKSKVLETAGIKSAKKSIQSSGKTDEKVVTDRKTVARSLTMDTKMKTPCSDKNINRSKSFQKSQNAGGGSVFDRLYSGKNAALRITRKDKPKSSSRQSSADTRSIATSHDSENVNFSRDISPTNSDVECHHEVIITSPEKPVKVSKVEKDKTSHTSKIKPTSVNTNNRVNLNSKSSETQPSLKRSPMKFSNHPNVESSLTKKSVDLESKDSLKPKLERFRSTRMSMREAPKPQVSLRHTARTRPGQSGDSVNKTSPSKSPVSKKSHPLKKNTPSKKTGDVILETPEAVTNGETQRIENKDSINDSGNFELSNSEEEKIERLSNDVLSCTNISDGPSNPRQGDSPNTVLCKDTINTTVEKSTYNGHIKNTPRGTLNSHSGIVENKTDDNIKTEFTPASFVEEVQQFSTAMDSLVAHSGGDVDQLMENTSTLSESVETDSGILSPTTKDSDIDKTDIIHEVPVSTYHSKIEPTLNHELSVEHKSDGKTKQEIQQDNSLNLHTNSNDNKPSRTALLAERWLTKAGSNNAETASLLSDGKTRESRDVERTPKVAQRWLSSATSSGADASSGTSPSLARKSIVADSWLSKHSSTHEVIPKKPKALPIVTGKLSGKINIFESQINEQSSLVKKPHVFKPKLATAHVENSDDKKTVLIEEKDTEFTNNKVSETIVPKKKIPPPVLEKPSIKKHSSYKPNLTSQQGNHTRESPVSSGYSSVQTAEPVGGTAGYQDPGVVHDKQGTSEFNQNHVEKQEKLPTKSCDPEVQVMNHQISKSVKESVVDNVVVNNKSDYHSAEQVQPEKQITHYDSTINKPKEEVLEESGKVDQDKHISSLPHIKSSKTLENQNDSVFEEQNENNSVIQTGRALVHSSPSVSPKLEKRRSNTKSTSSEMSEEAKDCLGDLGLGVNINISSLVQNAILMKTAGALRNNDPKSMGRRTNELSNRYLKKSHSQFEFRSKDLDMALQKLVPMKKESKTDEILDEPKKTNSAILRKSHSFAGSDNKPRVRPQRNMYNSSKNDKLVLSDSDNEINIFKSETPSESEEEEPVFTPHKSIFKSKESRLDNFIFKPRVSSIMESEDQDDFAAPRSRLGRRASSDIGRRINMRMGFSSMVPDNKSDSDESEATQATELGVRNNRRRNSSGEVGKRISMRLKNLGQRYQHDDDEN